MYYVIPIFIRLRNALGKVIQLKKTHQDSDTTIFNQEEYTEKI